MPHFISVFKKTDAFSKFANWKYLISQKFNGTNYPIIPTAQSDFLNENIWAVFRCFAFHFNSAIRNLDSFYRIHWPSFSCFHDPPYMDWVHITAVWLHSHIVLGLCWPLSFQSKHCHFLLLCHLDNISGNCPISSKQSG